MWNRFITEYESECDRCGKTIDKGEIAHQDTTDGMIVCDDCGGED